MGITPNRTKSIGLTFFGPSVDFSIMFPSTGITEKEGVGGEVYRISSSFRTRNLKNNVLEEILKQVGYF